MTHEAKPTKRERLLSRLRDAWAETVGPDKVFFIIQESRRIDYSPRYKGTRDRSRKTNVIIKHSLTDNKKRLHAFMRKVWITNPNTSFQY